MLRARRRGDHFQLVLVKEAFMEGLMEGSSYFQMKQRVIQIKLMTLLQNVESKKYKGHMGADEPGSQVPSR